MKFIFGPINSRRFGISLGIDLSPNVKQCNFDCVYCELDGAKTMQEQKISHKPSLILEEIKQTLKQHKTIDVLTITANGEPTLYPYLDELIDNINELKIKEDYSFKTLILSNSGKIMQKQTQDTLKKFDIVKLSLDCISKKCFRKLDRVNKNINTLDIIKGIKHFRVIYKKELVLEILFVKNINDNKQEIKLLSNTIKKIKPNRVDINTIDRPPAYNYVGLNECELLGVSKLFLNMPCEVTIAKAKNQATNQTSPDKQDDTYNKNSTENKNSKSMTNIKKYFSKKDILHTLKRRPLSTYDIKVLFNKKAKQNLKELEKTKKIKKQKTNNQIFFVF